MDMTPTPPYIERFREMVELHINGEDTRKQFIEDAIPLIAEEIQKARQEGAEEKMREILEIVAGMEITEDERYGRDKRKVVGYNKALADLRGRLTRK